MNELASAADPIDQVFNWILAGAAEHEIIGGVRAHWPESDPKPLIVAAFERIAASAQAEAATIHGWCIEATRLVYQKAVESGDWSTALRAVKQLHSFAG